MPDLESAAIMIICFQRAFPPLKVLATSFSHHACFIAARLRPNTKQFVTQKHFNRILPLPHRRLRRPIHRYVYTIYTTKTYCYNNRGHNLVIKLQFIPIILRIVLLISTFYVLCPPNYTIGRGGGGKSTNTTFHACRFLTIFFLKLLHIY